jgi:flagellar hook-associated protein 3 FlgL
MRIADSTRLDTVMRDISSVQQQLYAASRKASSGNRVGCPSDDPVAAAQLVRIRGAISDTETYGSVLTTVRGDLELSESTLDSASSVVGQIHDLALQAGNGSLTSSDRSTLSAQIKQLKSELVGLANQKGSVGFLFAGTADQSAPFSATGTFLASAQDRVAQIGPGQSMVVSASGALAFTTLGGSDVFAEIDTLTNALDLNDQTAVSASVKSMDTCQRQIVAAQADAGTKLVRMDTAEAAFDQAKVALSGQGSLVGDADAVESYARLTALQQGLQTSISVAKTLLDTLSVQQL